MLYSTLDGKMIGSFMDKLFQHADKDGNRRLSRNEFPKIIRVLIQMLGADPATSDQIDDIFNLLDFNGDETIDRKELYSLLKTFLRVLEEKKIEVKIDKQSDLII